MLHLTPTMFERFVGYVFSQAGYGIKHVARNILRGVDLELESSQQPKTRLGGVEVKLYAATSLVQLRDVSKLLGARCLSNGKVTGYLVTTSDFTDPAYQAALGRNACLINGDSLVRYINYVRGSRYKAINAATAYAPPTEVIAPDEFPRSAELIRAKTTATRVLAISNNKGGVGKSTTARYLAQNIAASGKTVLIIDLDAQSNLSEYLFDRDGSLLPAPNIAEYFAGQRTLAEVAVKHTIYPNVSMLPSHPSLRWLDSGGLGRPSLEARFILDLYRTFAHSPSPKSEPSFDWIILDTPPALSLFTRLALGAAHYVLAPVRSRASSVTGTKNMLDTVDAMNALVGKSPHLIGGLVTHWQDDETSKNMRKILENLFQADARDSTILSTAIPFDATIEKSRGRRTKADIAYESVTEEVLTYVNKHTW